MVNPANIFRSKRRTVTIHVDPKGELIVNAPLGMSDRRIFELIKAKGDWIRAQQARVLKNSYINRNVASYNTFLYLGTELVPVICHKTKQITRQDGALLIPGKMDQTKIMKKIEKWLRDRAKEVMHERATYFSQVLKLNATGVGTNNNKTRWGSCTRGGELAINWRAIMLKPDLLDYIIVHEFCHLLEFNHTKNFWGIVQTILPNWRATRIQLKHMGWLLQLFREPR